MHHYFSVPVFLAGISGSGGRPYAREQTVAPRRGSTNRELSAKGDVFTGMFVSKLVIFFIILTTAATLHAHGVRNIETAKQASEALRPLAGQRVYWLFTLGLIGTGMLGVP